MRNLLLVILGLGILGANAAQASIHYELNLPPGTFTATGFIETDGTLGLIHPAQILSWSISLNVNNQTATFSSTDPNAAIIEQFGPALYATPTALFAGDINNPASGSFIFHANPQQGGAFLVINPIFNSQILATQIYGTTGNTASLYFPAFGVEVAHVSAAVPEPATLFMFGLGSLGLSYAGWQRRKKK